MAGLPINSFGKVKGTAYSAHPLGALTPFNPSFLFFSNKSERRDQKEESKGGIKRRDQKGTLVLFIIKKINHVPLVRRLPQF
jgi:hypothetical protein